MKQLIASFFIALLLTSPVLAGKQENTYKIPDVREAFCGPEIAPRFCKCAFHNQCGQNMDQGASYDTVLSGFREWNRQNIQAMGEACKRADGHWNKSTWTCTYCTEGDERQGTRCVAPEKIDPEVAECKAALRDFPSTWEKYSDFDDRYSDGVSYEVQMFNETLDDIGLLIAMAHEIEYELVIKEEIRQEMLAYKEALVRNIRQNVTKALFRLTWVTYNTTKGALGSKGSVEKLLEPTKNVEQIGATLKIMQSNIPPSAKSISFSGSTTASKVGSMAWNATLEAMESSLNPAEIAKQGMKDVKGAVVGGPDITEEEVAILRDQHLSNKAVDEAIAESYAETGALHEELAEMKKLITEKYAELNEWRAKEYQRVEQDLQEQCKDKV
jgi:hypothetical protein